MSAAIAAQVNGNGVGKAVGKGKQNKNAFRRAKKKADKAAESETPRPEEPVATKEEEKPTTNGDADRVVTASREDAASRPIKDEDGDDDDYEQFGVQNDDPLYAQFADILARFSDRNKQDPAQEEPDKGEVFYEDDNDVIPDEDEEAAQKISKRKRKAMSKLSVAELKSIVRKPELVEWTDVSAPDPRLLISIKGARNVVPVPTHWSLKREYLSSKRGIEKAHFALPKFIADTGISEMRDSALEKDAEKTLKQRQRERVAPKMGKLDIDYQKLYEAFFKHQTKPELTRYGEVYYEGKEYETNLRHLRPGEISDELREALGMPPGAPPPWLINMQRFGPPLSYPGLKIAGVNAPIPPGSKWGFNPGEWGKPPVDDYNRPLYGGDIFGSLEQPRAAPPEGQPIERTLWGELQAREEESEPEEEEEEEEDEDEPETTGLDRSAGLKSAAPTEIGGAESIAGDFNLYKDPAQVRGGDGMRSGATTEEPAAGRQAYQVLNEHSIQNKGFFGGERAYDLSNAPRPILGQEHNTGRKRKQGDVDVAVDVDALESGLGKDEMRRRYDEGRREEGGWRGGRVDQEDLGAMIEEEGRKRLKKDEERREGRRQGRGGR